MGFTTFTLSSWASTTRPSLRLSMVSFIVSESRMPYLSLEMAKGIVCERQRLIRIFDKD